VRPAANRLATGERVPEYDTWTIDFGPRLRATAVAVPRDVSGEDAVAALALPPPRGVIVLNGGTTELDRNRESALRGMLGEGLAQVAADERLTVVTGATDAGIFALFGQALGARRAAPCVGVAPLGRVTWPGREAAHDESVRLEPHHSHFLLVEGDDWGDETEAMLALTATLGADRPSVAVLAGGGEGAKRELLGHARAGREVIVLAGSGRFADEVAETRTLDPGGAAARISVVDLADPASTLADTVRARMADRGKSAPE
jgi:hypothetical protein